jgi:hypothetical protein
MSSYPGGKAGAGVPHKLINLMPPHPVFCSPFLGNCAVMRLKRPAAYNIGVDLDAEVIAAWVTSSGGNAGYRSRSGENAVGAGGNGGLAAGARAERGNLVGAADLPRGDGGYRGKLLGAANLPPSAVPGEIAASHRRRTADLPLGSDGGGFTVRYLGGGSAAGRPRFRFLRGDGLTFLASYPFQPADLVYCDPPYLMETRSGGRLYRHEMSDDQHAELLTTILELPCRVMISGYWSEMYASRLQRWNCITFEAMTRGGMATEWLWFNFPEPVELHDYRFIGENARKRQDFRRQIRSWTGKLERMAPLKKQALLAAIAAHGESADKGLDQERAVEEAPTHVLVSF